jgi:tetratricopeptide (TPR) repeat protein
MLVGAVPGLLYAQPQAQDAQTQDPYYHFLMARHLESEGDTAGALAALQRAAAADPRAADIHAEVALLQYRRNQREEAEKAAKTALSIDSDNIEANRVMGFLQVAAYQNERATPAERRERLRSAIMYLERVAAVQPTPDLSLTTTLGRLYLTNGETDKAIEALTRALNQNPFSFDIRQTLAIAFASVNDYARAIGALEDLAEEDPRALALIGDYQYRAGQHTQATDTLTRVLATQPNNPEIKELRIRAAYGARRYEEAASYAADARRQHPDVPQFAALQSQALFKTGDTGQAIELMEAAVKSFPKSAYVQYALADLYNDSGRDTDAEQVLRRILEANPSDPNALNHLGYLLAVHGRNLDEAITLVMRALKVRPNTAEYLDSLGWAHFKRGDLDEAEKYLNDAAQRLPDNSEILDHLGDLHAARGRWAEAMAAWRRAIAADNSDIDRAALEKKIEDALGRIGR